MCGRAEAEYRDVRDPPERNPKNGCAMPETHGIKASCNYLWVLNVILTFLGKAQEDWPLSSVRTCGDLRTAINQKHVMDRLSSTVKVSGLFAPSTVIGLDGPGSRDRLSPHNTIARSTSCGKEMVLNVGA